MILKIKSQKTSIFIYGFSIILLLLIMGCSSKPNNAQIEEAVKIQLQNQVPGSWVRSFTGGHNAKINTIEIVEFGNYNSERKYWPIKIRVIGSAIATNPFGNENRVQFNTISEFRLKKDDYGKWRAYLNGGVF